MLSVKMRFLGIVFIPLLILLWWIPTNGVLGDYQDLLNQTDEVRLSLITLIVPIGGFIPLLISVALISIAIYSGKQARLVIGEKWTSTINRSCIYSMILGVVFAVVFALYCIKLLDEYGYKYSYELTDITPTGIHLMYVKTQ